MSDTHKPVALEVVEHQEERAMSPVVAAGMRMLRQSPSPETLRELLKVQQEWEANEARKAYAMAMVGLKRNLPAVINRDKQVSYPTRGGDPTTYRHATLANVLDKVQPILGEHGFSMAWQPATRESRVYVTCRLTHQAGHSEATTLDAPIDNSGGKNPVQGIGSTITYLQRYSACSLLGIATADMPDADDKPEQGASDQDKPAPASERVDANLNLRAVGWLKTQGRTVAQAVEFLKGRKVEDWTQADRERLKVWAKPAEAAQEQDPQT